MSAKIISLSIAVFPFSLLYSYMALIFFEKGFWFGLSTFVISLFSSSIVWNFFVVRRDVNIEWKGALYGVVSGFFAIYTCSLFFSLSVNCSKNYQLLTYDALNVFNIILPETLKSSIVFGTMTIASIGVVVVPVCAISGYISIFFVDLKERKDT